MVFLQDGYLGKSHKYSVPVTDSLSLSSQFTFHCLLYDNEAGLPPLSVGMMLSFVSRGGWENAGGERCFSCWLKSSLFLRLSQWLAAPSTLSTSWVTSQQSAGAKVFPHEQVLPAILGVGFQQVSPVWHHRKLCHLVNEGHAISNELWMSALRGPFLGAVAQPCGE